MYGRGRILIMKVSSGSYLKVRKLNSGLWDSIEIEWFLIISGINIKEMYEKEFLDFILSDEDTTAIPVLLELRCDLIS